MSNRDLARWWGEKHGYVLLDHLPPCLREVTGERCLLRTARSPGAECDGCRRRYFDHTHLWAHAGAGSRMPVALTTQPYGLTDRAIAEAKKDASRFGLTVTFSDRSWWNPPSTVLIHFFYGDEDDAR